MRGVAIVSAFLVGLLLLSSCSTTSNMVIRIKKEWVDREICQKAGLDAKYIPLCVFANRGILKKSYTARDGVYIARYEVTKGNLPALKWIVKINLRSVQTDFLSTAHIVGYALTTDPNMPIVIARTQPGAAKIVLKLTPFQRKLWQNFYSKYYRYSQKCKGYFHNANDIKYAFIYSYILLSHKNLQKSLRVRVNKSVLFKNWDQLSKQQKAILNSCMPDSATQFDRPPVVF